MTRPRPTSVLAIATALSFAPFATAQVIPVPLNYNFNGIVHAGEAGNPDSLTGYRSISDRGLDFSLGVPNDPLLAPYQFILAPDTLDIVHLGNRNTVDGGNWAFDLVVNGDLRGVQPAWLPNPDQTAAQVTVLATPLPIADTTQIAFLYQISNGGGSFDVTFMFQSGGSHTESLSGSDWFGGPYPGTQDCDLANFGNNLSVTEGRIDMAAFDGQLVTQIGFGNRSNANAGYAVLACNFEYPPEPSRVNRVPLAYNFNGVVHAGEDGMPDAPAGYRSISDRGLDFRNGVPANPLLADYLLVDQPGVLDIVHLGNRNTVDAGLRAFDLVPDGDDIGIQPTWLANPDQTGPQTTVLADPIVMDATSRASVLFQISNGGGAFDLEFQFQAGAPVVATVSGPDWFGGALPGTGNTDLALTSANLSLTERTVDLSAQAGRVLTAVAFQNRSNGNAGYAIAAMNVVGCVWCANGAPGGVVNLGGGSGATMTTTSTGGLGCPLTWRTQNAAPNALGVFALSAGSVSVPLGVVLPGCPGTIHTPSPLLVTALTTAFGTAEVELEVPPNQGLCGAVITGQHVVLGPLPCWLVLSDAISITIGN